MFWESPEEYSELVMFSIFIFGLLLALYELVNILSYYLFNYLNDSRNHSHCIIERFPSLSDMVRWAAICTFAWRLAAAFNFAKLDSNSSHLERFLSSLHTHMRLPEVLSFIALISAFFPCFWFNKPVLTLINLGWILSLIIINKNRKPIMVNNTKLMI